MLSSLCETMGTLSFKDQDYNIGHQETGVNILLKVTVEYQSKNATA